MYRKNLMKDTIDLYGVEVNDIPCLFSQVPIDRFTVPNGFRAFDIYYGDTHKPTAIVVECNRDRPFGGTIIVEDHMLSIKHPDDIFECLVDKIRKFKTNCPQEALAQKLFSTMNKVSKVIS